MKRLLLVVISLSLLLSGCGVLGDAPTAPTTAAPPPDGNWTPGDAEPIVVDFEKTDSDMFTDRDERSEYADGVMIQLNGDSVTCNSAAVKVEGTAITIAKKGTYILRGSLKNGSVTVNADSSDKLQIVLDGADITCEESAALSIVEADKVFVTLAEGTENRLANGSGFSSDTVDGAVFSKQDLTFNGAGSLTVESPAAHGIVCKDDLLFTGGSYTIRSAFHGLDANDSVRLKNASLNMDAGKDGIHVEDSENTTTGFVYISGGTLDIEAEGDGISAAVWLQIKGGDTKILAGGGYTNGENHSSGGYGDFMGGGPGGMGGGRPDGRAETTTDEASTSMKGLKADGGILVTAGAITIDSADDGIHSNAVAVINGGTVEIASGDDGIHAETGLSIAAGTINISNCYEGMEAQNVHVSGGKLSLVAKDDGINAAGGNDSSGTGGRDEMPGRPAGPGGPGGVSNGSIIIDGGDLYIQSSGDGMDANGYLEINGGKTVICGPNRGDTATLDFDTGGSINGGIFIGTGASGMAQTFTANTQGVLAARIGNQSSGVTITISDKDGKELISHQSGLAFSAIIFSAPELISGETYRVAIGDMALQLTAY